MIDSIIYILGTAPLKLICRLMLILSIVTLILGGIAISVARSELNAVYKDVYNNVARTGELDEDKLINNANSVFDKVSVPMLKIGEIKIDAEEASNEKDYLGRPMYIAVYRDIEIAGGMVKLKLTPSSGGVVNNKVRFEPSATGDTGSDYRLGNEFMD